MKKISFVIGTLAAGGAERQLTLLATSLNSKGWDVQVVCLDKVGRFVDELEKQGISILNAGFRSRHPSRLVRLSSLLKAQFFLIWHCLRRRPHVVHGFLPLTNFMAAFAGWITMRPHRVISKRSLGLYQDTSRALRMMDKVANRLAHSVTANSNAVALDTQARDAYPADRISVIYNGLNVDRFEALTLQDRDKQRDSLGIGAEKIAIIKVANLIPYKGHEDLIRAMAVVVASCPYASLYLAGDDRGIELDLKALAESLNIRDHVIFLGSCDNIPELLNAMDIGVMASHQEGMPNAVIEKLAAGLPVVATDVGGVAEVLENADDCQLVVPHSIEPMAHALTSSILHHTDTKSRRAKRQQHVKEKFSEQKMVGDYISLYQSN